MTTAPTRTTRKATKKTPRKRASSARPCKPVNRAANAPKPTTTWRLYDWQSEAWRSRERFVAAVTPLGDGKTWFGARWFLMRGLENPGSIHLGIAAGYIALQDIMLPAFEDALEESGVRYTHRKQARETTVHSRGKDIVFRFRTVETKRAINRLRGPEYGVAWMDEARNCSRYAMSVANARLRCPHTLRHQMLLTTTPNGYDWIHDGFVENATKDKRLIHVRKRTNYRLPEDYDAQLIGEMTPDMAAQEVGAEFVLIGVGRCYRNFDRFANVREMRYEPTQPLALMVDYGAETTVVVCQFIDGQLRVLDEFRASGMDQVTRQVASAYPSHRSGVDIFDDAAGGIQRSGATGKTHRAILIENLAGWGGAHRPRRGNTNPSICERIEAVNRALVKSLTPMVPRVAISPKCKRLIRDFEQVAWAQDGRSQDKTDNTLTHFADAVGYGIWELMRPSMFVSEPAYGMGSRTRDRNVRGGAR